MTQPQHWHHSEIDAVLEAVESTAQGLSIEEAEARLKRNGPNRLPAPPKRSALVRFLLQFHNILIYVLLSAALVTALMDHITDTLVILAVVVANAIIGFIQEGKAESALEAIKKMLAPHAAVIRSGTRKSIDGEDLVVGDVVLLEAGDKVPADLRLFKTHSLQIQEAILTGESLPVDKGTKIVKEDAALGDRVNMAFSGTTVTAGTAQGVVIATGVQTEIGRISGLLQSVQTLTTPLVEQMDTFAKWLTAFILILSATIMGYELLTTEQHFDGLFMAIVGLAVAAIPEGLPAVLTITLAIGVQAMAKRNAIVRRLPAIETIGAVSVICSDKTGTLTRNEMMVTTLITQDKTYTVKGEGYTPVGDFMEGGTSVAPNALILEMARVCALCNDAELKNHDAQWHIEGDPMEGALLSMAAKAGLEIKETTGTFHRTDAIPFDAKNQYMATLHHDHAHHAFIVVKGAPEKLLAMCARVKNTQGTILPLDRSVWEAHAASIAKEGQRVLALAYKEVDASQTVLSFEDVKEGLVLLGLVGLIDPPRSEAITAIAECHQAGISVKMITGDHALTAGAIGKQIGLKHTDTVLTGTQIDDLDDEALSRKVLETDIFARTTPEHKLKLVMALQAHNLTVAMTGDGVNDSPALKRADAGIAMGQNGSEAAKEASELVLADDNFASIAAAVKEGRTVYNNIKKVISWTLPTNAGEALVIIIALLFAMQLPVTPIQILWVNMITAVTLGIALAFEPADADVMMRKPRKRKEPILNKILVWQVIYGGVLFVIGVFALYFMAIERGETIDYARTLAMNTLIFVEIIYLFYIRNMNTPTFSMGTFKGTQYVWMAIGFVFVAQALMTYASFMQNIFDTQSLLGGDVAMIFAVGVIVFTLVEVEKIVRMRFFTKTR